MFLYYVDNFALLDLICKLVISSLSMTKNLIFVLLSFLVFSCSIEREKEELNADKVPKDTTLSLDLVDDVLQEEPVISELELKLIEAGLVNVQDVDSTIQVDVKYASTDNFMGIVLYDGFHKVYLQSEVAEKLSIAQKALKNIDENLTLLVFDGARPRSVQQLMWDALDTIPVNERTKFVSNPKNGSIHNYGCAVDLTIANVASGEWLDMGAGYDDIRKIAYPRHEEYYLKLGELTNQHIENRKLLRKVMKQGGFWVIQTEWWHFNAYTRDKAKQLFEIIE